MTLYGLDISNHQTMAYREMPEYEAADFVIVQAINPPKPFAGWEIGGYTAAQLRAGREDGKYIGVYVWLWNTFATSAATKADIAGRLALIPEYLSLDMRLWLDVEDTNTDIGQAREQDVLDALEVMDAWSEAHGLPPPGIYSGDWYLNGYMGGWFPDDRMYWQANYGYTRETATEALLPARPVIQYSADPIDQNVMSDSEIIGLVAPPDDECQQKVNDLVNAMGYLVGDALEPLTRATAPKYVKTYVAEARRVAEQFGIEHA